MKRVTVSMNDKTYEILKKHQEHLETTQAEVIRKALTYLDAMEQATAEVDLRTVLAYVDFLANREHLIVDISQWRSLLNAVGKGSKEFWDEVFTIGDDHRKEYADKGLIEPGEVLEFIATANWFTLRKDSSQSYTLVLAVPESSRFITTFLQGFFSKHPRKVEVREESMKIRISVL